tara:strand:- start:152 stop:499 length:348 start_codon:yes stop_codon:yes gene_type:complete
MTNKAGIRKGKDFTKNMEKLKKIYGGKIPKNLTFKEADAALKKVTPFKKKTGGSTDFGMLSVKYGVDNNPNPTHADRIAAATKGKKPKTAEAGTGKFMVKGMGAAIRGGLTKGSS